MNQDKDQKMNVGTQNGRGDPLVYMVEMSMQTLH